MGIKKLSGYSEQFVKMKKEPEHYAPALSLRYLYSIIGITLAK